ncbi:MAG: polysaccharide deacetylase family protein [Thermoleophilia bacterium]|nr:polysaccharide deacetylase family protein [Thermoleophilia bacterium]
MTTRRRNGERTLTVLAYHRVAPQPDPGFRAPDPAAVEPHEFARQIRWLAGRYTPVGLDDLDAAVTGGAPLPRRALLVTFDDGYRDVLEHAVPVLSRSGVPAVVFAVTGAMGTRRLMWWSECAHIAGTARGRRTLPSGQVVDMDDPAARRRVYDSACAFLKRLDTVPRAAGIAALGRALGVEDRPPGHGFLSWDDLPVLRRAGVCVQAHTVTHAIVGRIPPHRAEEEITGSLAAVADATGRPATAFAYPNGELGDFGEAAAALLRRAGVRLAFTMLPGPGTVAAARRAPHEIPRIGVYRADTLATLALKVAGVARARRAVRRTLRGHPASTAS